MKADWIETTEFSITPAAVKSSATNVLPAGTVIVASRVGLGKVCRLRQDTAINQDLRGFIPKSAKQLDPQYLFLWFKSVADQIVAAGTGATVQGVTLPFLRSLQIPLPPLKEQRRIVAVLDEAFAAIATATANVETNLANAQELFDEFLSAAFGGTTNEWDVFTIGEVCTLRSGTTVRAELEQPSGEVPYLKVADMSHPDNLDKVTTSSRFLRRSDVGRNALIPAGATIFPKRGGAIMTNKKRLVATPMAADLNIMSVIPGPRLAARFLNYYFQNVDMRLLGSGSSIPQINNYDIEPLKIAIPDEAAQVDFVTKTDAMKSEILKLAAIYRRKIEQLSQLKQSLLHRAFSGELTSKASEVVALNDSFATPEFAAKVVAFAYERHVAKNRVRNFGTVKAEKILHMVEAIGGIDLGRQPSREAAGPDDAKHRHATWDWARSQHFFRFNKRSGGGHDFEKLSSYSGMIEDARTTIAGTAVEKAIELLVDMDRDFAELITTTYAAWNNLIIDRCAATDDDIVLAARDKWHRDKLRFDPSRFYDAIRFIRNNNIVPDGTAKRVGGQEALLF